MRGVWGEECGGLAACISSSALLVPSPPWEKNAGSIGSLASAPEEPFLAVGPGWRCMPC